MNRVSRNLSVVSFVVIGVLVLTGNIQRASASLAAKVFSPFVYSFNSNGVLQEINDINLSSSPYWWLNSGAYIFFSNGVGTTVKGNLPSTDPWRIIYAASNPADTDNGYHPQNVFRLVTRSKWRNEQQTSYMKIMANNLSTSTNRNASNGLLLLNRYLDGSNLYYVGLRVDGAAVVKKKKNGIYYTLAYKKIFSGTYDRIVQPNLLPLQTWIGIRSEVVNNSDGTVSLKLYTDIARTGQWKLVLSAIDNNRSFGGSAITAHGYAGIRTDFMDVEFDDFRLVSL